MKILINAGYSEGECYGLINKLDGNDKWIGYDIKSETYANMKGVGIIDPSKVTRNALENAASIAGTVLLTEAAVVEIKDKNDNNNNAGMMPGMY
jgi:chaperonin GroEL